MFYINQRDYPDMLYPTLLDTPEHPKSGKTTVFSSACGPCSAMMALDRRRSHRARGRARGRRLYRGVHA